MTFNETEHPRATDGKFAEKTGAAPEIALESTFPADFPKDYPVAEQIAWALRNDAEVTLHDNGKFVTTASGLELTREWHDLRLGALPEVVAVRMPDSQTPQTTLDAISVKDTTAADRFVGASDAAWSRYRSEQENLRRMIPEVLAERTKREFPDATGIVFETETLDDGATITDYSLISIEGPDRMEMRSTPFVSDDFKSLQRIEDDLGEYCRQVADIESDWHDVATVHSNSGPQTRWEITF